MGRGIPRLLVDLEPHTDFGHGWFDKESYAQIMLVCRSLYEEMPPGIATVEVIDVSFQPHMVDLDPTFSGVVRMQVNVKGVRVPLPSGNTVSLEDLSTWGYVIADAKRFKAHKDRDIASRVLPLHALIEHFRRELHEHILQQLRGKERAFKENSEGLSKQVERVKQRLASR